jgi:hypothetical protein
MSGIGRRYQDTSTNVAEQHEQDDTASPRLPEAPVPVHEDGRTDCEEREQARRCLRLVQATDRDRGSRPSRFDEIERRAEQGAQITRPGRGPSRARIHGVVERFDPASVSDKERHDEHPPTTHATPRLPRRRSHQIRRNSGDGYDTPIAAAAARPTRTIGMTQGGYSTGTRHAPSYPASATKPILAYNERARVAAMNAALASRA